jgi:hypothetical protein
MARNQKPGFDYDEAQSCLFSEAITSVVNKYAESTKTKSWQNFIEDVNSINKTMFYDYPDDAKLIVPDSDIIVPIRSIKTKNVYETRDDYDNINSRYTKVEKDGKWGIINSKGKVVVRQIYDYIENFDHNNGRLLKHLKLLSSNAHHYLYQPTYFAADPLNKGRTKVKKASKHGLIDTNGKVIVPVIYEELEYFKDGRAMAKKSSKWGFINARGKEIIPFNYDSASYFNDGRAPVKKDGKYGFINNEGDLVVPLIYDQVFGFLDGTAKVMKDGKWGYIDMKGTQIIPIIYEEVESFNEGMACVKKDGKWGYYNSKGALVVPFLYNAAGNFNYGRAVVQKDKLCGYINSSGKVAIPLKYDFAREFEEGGAKVERYGQLGIIDSSGCVVKPIFYEPSLLFLLVQCNTR